MARPYNLLQDSEGTSLLKCLNSMKLWNCCLFQNRIFQATAGRNIKFKLEKQDWESNLRPWVNCFKIELRACKDHVCKAHVCKAHVCQDHVCQDHVCQVHVCQDHVCQTIFVKTMLVKNMIWQDHVCPCLSRPCQCDPILSNLIQLDPFWSN